MHLSQLQAIAALSCLVAEASPLYCQAAASACSNSTTKVEESASVLSACRSIPAATMRDANAIRAAAVSLMRLNRFEEATSAWREYIDRAPDDFSGRYNLGLALELSGDSRASLSPFHQAFLLARKTADKQSSAWHVGVAYYNTEKVQDALRWFRIAVQLDPTDASALSYAAIAAARLDRTALALEYWSRVLSQNPQYFATATTHEREWYQKTLVTTSPRALRPPRAQ